MKHKYRLPEPSGEVKFFDHLKNSYGTMGVYKVGNSEIENPKEDVEYHAQGLADSIAALEYENSTKIDKLAALARDTYYGLNNEGLRGWDSLSDEFRDRWREAIRVVLIHVG
jgi:hypothetical protein